MGTLAWIWNFFYESDLGNCVKCNKLEKIFCSNGSPERPGTQETPETPERPETPESSSAENSNRPGSRGWLISQKCHNSADKG